MQYNIIPFEVKLAEPAQAFSFEVGALHQILLALVDKRGRKGRIYGLATILTIAVLAKLNGQNQIRAIAAWAKLRQRELTTLFDTAHLSMPHHTTWSRILGEGVDVIQLEQVVSQFFQKHLASTIAEVGSLVLAIDGKTLRGTIPSGGTRGVHLMAAYLPSSGVVLAQVAVEAKHNEIEAAPRLLAQLDLRGMVVAGDAMQCQRALSVQIVQAGGEYLWFVKANQASLLTDLQVLFDPEPLAAGHSPAPTDFRTVRRVEKAHGRLEIREITVSSMLEGYSQWPHLAQVFKLEYWSEPLARPSQATSEPLAASKTKTKTKTKAAAAAKAPSLKPERSGHEVRYAITSLTATEAGPARLMEIARGEWSIENQLHYRRDVTLGEDASQLRLGNAPQANAILNNTVLGLLGLAGVVNVAQARRELAYLTDKLLSQLAT